MGGPNERGLAGRGGEASSRRKDRCPWGPLLGRRPVITTLSLGPGSPRDQKSQATSRGLMPPETLAPGDPKVSLLQHPSSPRSGVRSKRYSGPVRHSLEALCRSESPAGPEGPSAILPCPFSCLGRSEL